MWARNVFGIVGPGLVVFRSPRQPSNRSVTAAYALDAGPGTAEPRQSLQEAGSSATR